MDSLFSIFDPVSSIGFFGLNWFSVLSILLVLPSLFHILKRKFLIFFSLILNYLTEEFFAALGRFKAPGLPHIFVSFFLLISCINFIGLFPYIFTSSSHLRITIRIAVPVWLGYMIYLTIYYINFFLSHLVPLGTPVLLIPLMVIIEIVRRLIRPITLSVRLAANMVAGHLLMALISGPISVLRFFRFFLILSGLLLLTVLELAVSFIQAYVFRTLMSLYIIEVNSPNF